MPSSEELIKIAIARWSKEPQRDVMLPGLGAKTCGELADALTAALSQPALPGQEAVAWLAYCAKTGGKCVDTREGDVRDLAERLYSEHGYTVSPLYTHPLAPEVPDTPGLVTVAWRVPNLVSGWNATCNSEQAAEWRANVRPVGELVSRVEAAAATERLREARDEAIKDAALFSAGIELLEKALSATIQPLEHASQCLDGIVSMDDEDQGKDGGSATCQAVKRTVDRALKNVRRALEGSKR